MNFDGTTDDALGQRVVVFKIVHRVLRVLCVSVSSVFKQTRRIRSCMTSSRAVGRCVRHRGHRDTETQRNFVISHQRLYRPRTVEFAVLRLRRVHQDRRAAFLSTPSQTRPAPRAHWYLAPRTATGISVEYAYAGMPCSYKYCEASSTSTSPARDATIG